MKESEIRPKALFDRYLELVQGDISRLFSDDSDFVVVPCPGCGASESSADLEKWGFQFVSCAACGSLYVSPRPKPAALTRYYRESEAVRYWDVFYKETEAARRARVFRPRGDLVANWAARLSVGERATYADVGAGYGIFLEEIGERHLFEAVIGIEPVPALAAVCRAKGFPVVEKFLEDVEPEEICADFASAFEVLEHLFDPALFLTAARRILRPGGILLMTTLTVSGFDIQVLREHSKSVAPPMHINFLTVGGARRLLERSGFDIIDLSTPGRLDVNIVENARAQIPGLSLPLFVRTLLDEGEDARRDFQEFLAKHNLSSHLQIVARLAA